MGEILPDRDLFSSLSASCPFPIDQETRGFQGEHSIEFVVIWLQALRDLFFPGRSFTILPILCGGYIDEFMNFVDWKAVEAHLPKA